MAIGYRDARAPEGVRLYAIGDVHGRLDLLERMHAVIAAELERDNPADWRIIHLGDYVDRGPDSRGVIDFLIARVQADPRNIALAGNHDAGFLDFLADPDGSGLFARYGGRETGLSYGVEIQFDRPDALRRGWAELSRMVPEKHRAFLRALPRSVTFGDFYFCHAGIRPGIPLERQDPEDLIWIRQEFLTCEDRHPKVIVHGHTPHREPQVMDNRVNIDTLAYLSGVLTAFVVDGQAKCLIQATE